MTLTATALICSSIALTFVIYLLSPLLRAEPLLMAIDKRFYKLEPVQANVVRAKANDILLETYIQEYVKLRHTYISDIDVMNERWGLGSHFYWFSAEEVYLLFNHSKEAKIQQILNGLTIEVQIRFVQNIYGALWVCEFDTIEYRPEEEYPTRNRWRAYLEVGYAPRKYPNRDEQIKNAINFHVDTYHLGSRGLHENSKDAKFYD